MSFTILNNSPSSGNIQWQNLHMTYKGTTYNIVDGYTNAIYSYWTPSTPSNLVVTNTFPTLGVDDCLIFLNKSGTAVVVPNSTVVSGDLIVPNSIIADSIASNTITGDKIKSGTITSSNIQTGTISADLIAVNAIGAEKIATSAITSDKIVSGAVTADKLAVNSVTANAIASNTITASKMVAGTITAISGIIADATITTAKIADGNITTAKIGDGQITNAKIVDATIQSAKIASIDASKITTGTLDANRIASGSIVVSKLDSTTQNNISAGASALSSAQSYADTKKAEATNANMWFCKRYAISGKSGSTISYDTILGNLPVQTTLVTDTTLNSVSTGSAIWGASYDNYVGYATTNVYVNSNVNLSVTLFTDDNGCIYVNGVRILGVTSCVNTAVTLPLVIGWNNIEVMWAEGGGGDGFYFPSGCLSQNGSIVKMQCSINDGSDGKLVTINGLVNTAQSSADTANTTANGTKGTVDSWKHTSDITKIDGGDIYTGSITADKIQLGTSNSYSLYVKGTGLNNSSNRSVKVNRTELLSTNVNTRGLDVIVLNRQTGAKIDEQIYDTHASQTAITNMTTYLNSLTNDKLVIITSYDAIGNGGATWDTNFINSLNNMGGNTQEVWNYILQGNVRTPYVLIGIPNIGIGKGIQQYTNAGSTTPPSEISTMVIDGAITGIGTSFTNATVIDGGQIQTGYMSADRMQGGTLTLGGSNNVNGSLAIKNASSQTIIQADKDSNGQYNIRAMDTGGNVRAKFGEYTSGRYGMAVYNQYGDLVTSSDRPPTKYETGIGASGCYISLSNVASGIVASANITSYLDNTITVDNVSGFAIGDIIYPTKHDNIYNKNTISDGYTITAINGNVITTNYYFATSYIWYKIYKITPPTATLNISSGFVVNSSGQYIKVNAQSQSITLGQVTSNDVDGLIWYIFWIDNNGNVQYTTVGTSGSFYNYQFIGGDMVLQLNGLPDTSPASGGTMIGAILSGYPKGNNLYSPNLQFVHQVSHDPSIRKQIPMYVDDNNVLCASNTSYIQWGGGSYSINASSNYVITIPIGSNKKSALIEINKNNNWNNMTYGFFGVVGRKNYNANSWQNTFGMSPSYLFGGGYMDGWYIANDNAFQSGVSITDMYIGDNSSGQVLKIVLYNNTGSTVTVSAMVSIHAF